jgi:hypothetical protein
MNTNKYIVLALINNSKNIYNLKNSGGGISNNNPKLTGSIQIGNYEIIKSDNVTETNITFEKNITVPTVIETSNDNTVALCSDGIKPFI